MWCSIIRKTGLFLSLIVISACLGCRPALPEIIVPEVSTGVELEGLGVELDPHFLSQNVTRGDGVKESDWTDIVARRVEMMSVQRFRVMLLPYWWEPEKGVFTFDSAEMRSLYSVLDLAEKVGAEVTLVLWGCPLVCRYVDENRPSQWKMHFLTDPKGVNWVTSPLDPDEFSECFSAVVKYLIEEKGYSCVKEVTPFNEPDGAVCEPEMYLRVVRSMDRRFREDGIRDKVRFNLSDNIDTDRDFLRICADSLSAEADLFNSHTYIFGYETPDSVVTAWERENVSAVASTGKKHFVGEFGSNLCVGASRQTDINRYERGVLLTRSCLNFLSAGAAGASYWSLIDQYYNRVDSYEIMQQLGLWRHKKDVYQGEDAEGCEYDYQVRPHYFAWSLLTRFVRRGDTVWPLDLRDEMAAGVAFRSKDGAWTYIFANGSGEDLSFKLSNPLRSGRASLSVYRYEEGKLPEGDAMISPSCVLGYRTNSCTVRLPAQSVLILTEKEGE